MQRSAFLTVAALPALLGATRPPATTDVAIETSAGTIVIRVDGARAPVTARNFLRLVDARLYDRASFYRATGGAGSQAAGTIAIVQGGILPRTDPFGPIPLEPTTKTGLHNAVGTIAMARTRDPNSATSEFFINLGDDTILDADNFPDHAGYAVFGRVLKGLDVARAIQQRPTVGERLDPPVPIVRARRVR